MTADSRPGGMRSPRNRAQPLFPASICTPRPFNDALCNSFVDNSQKVVEKRIFPKERRKNKRITKETTICVRVCVNISVKSARIAGVLEHTESILANSQLQCQVHCKLNERGRERQRQRQTHRTRKRTLLEANRFRILPQTTYGG